MEYYVAKADASSAPAVVCDDMLLTKELPTTAGSKMLKDYMSLFDAEVITKLKEAGYSINGKSGVGEFAIDLLGETNYAGKFTCEGKLVNPAAEIVKSGEAEVAVCMDVNGSVRRAAAQSNLVSVKPTYGTVSRYGTIPVACSGETVSVLAGTTDAAGKLLGVISGHDDKDGTSLSAELCKKTLEKGSVSKVCIIKDMLKDASDEVLAKINAFAEQLKSNGVEVCEIENSVIPLSKTCWNILMCAELCNNVSRYDGVKYGYRSPNFTNLDELYVNSRTEAFGDVLKTAILFGSETLSTDNYMKVYDKALRMRRVIAEEFASIFETYDAVIMPACSAMEYPENITDNKYIAFDENFYTAPASVTGLPAVVAEGVQLVGNAFSDSTLLGVAAICEKEGK